MTIITTVMVTQSKTLRSTLFYIFLNVPILTMSFTQAANAPESGVASPVHS